MSDRMSILPFDKLINWILTEYKREKSVFGIPEQKFYKRSFRNASTEKNSSLTGNNPMTEGAWSESSSAIIESSAILQSSAIVQNGQVSLFGKMLETPFGPAAGPNTQLAQNIIAAYLTGGRFFELKTVQVIDGEELPVSKPCILARDEGYNVEWSTELTVSEALEEYIKAWFVLKLIAREFSLGSKDGFLFNMSVGYDLEGIKSPKINAFIEGLKNASSTTIWKECRTVLFDNLNLWTKVDKQYIEEISPNICESITLSTLHGCPPDEIERIATYLIKEKGLHTFIKCNPTLLGYEFCRQTLDQMGYQYLSFDDHHFNNDLQFAEAVPMIARLKALAIEQGRTFGVKLTNTFPVRIEKKELPGEEMYLSGKPLYPLTIHLAYLLAKEFNGELRISYSGGADFFNIDKIYDAGIWPITVATTILKPGGYVRLKQLAKLLEQGSEHKLGIEKPDIEKLNIEKLDIEKTDIGKTDVEKPDIEKLDIKKLYRLAQEAVADPYYQKHQPQGWHRKLREKVPLLDCSLAPCNKGCPIEQDIPEYLRLVEEERYLEALEVITAKNPLPFITGTLCNHPCMSKCTRQDYEKAVGIRESKLIAAKQGFEALIKQIKPVELQSACKVAVIGGGPAGLAGAYFLRKNGIDVTVFEKRKDIGGVINHIAPEFRIPSEAIQQDMELIRKTGVKFKLGVEKEFSVEALKREGYKYIFIAIGAERPGQLQLEECDAKIINVLDFHETYHKAKESLNLGKRVAIIGAGNSAMDAARAASRVPGVEQVTLVYRRTKEYMPAAAEELELALKEGVELKELLTPISFNKGSLQCQRMELGAVDESGRRRPIPVPGAMERFEIDSVIAAVGEQVETEHFLYNKIEFDSKGRVWVNSDTNETSVKNVFLGGDALRGPATIVEGIADGTKVARIIIERENNQKMNLTKQENPIPEHQIEEIQEKRGILHHINTQSKDGKHCLECNIICNLCAEVCPNRANLAVRVMAEGIQGRNQILHLDGMCNECGNCETFCPYDSAPYKDKLTLYWSLKDFEDSRNAGFLLLDRAENRFRLRLGQEVEDIAFDSFGNCSKRISNGVTEVIWQTYTKYDYIFPD